MSDPDDDEFKRWLETQVEAQAAMSRSESSEPDDELVAVVLSREADGDKAAAQRQLEADGVAEEKAETTSWWRQAASFALDVIPVVGTIKSGVQLITGKDLVTGEPINRYLEVVGLVPAGKLLGKLGSGAAKLSNTLGKGTTERLLSAVEKLHMPKSGNGIADHLVRKKALLTDAIKSGQAKLGTVAVSNAERSALTAAMREQTKAKIVAKFGADSPKTQQYLGYLKKLDVDHKLDLQLGGANAATNAGYLCKFVNRSVGKQMQTAIKEIQATNSAAKAAFKDMAKAAGKDFAKESVAAGTKKNLVQLGADDLRERQEADKAHKDKLANAVDKNDNAEIDRLMGAKERQSALEAALGEAIDRNDADAIDKGMKALEEWHHGQRQEEEQEVEEHREEQLRSSDSDSEENFR